MCRKENLQSINQSVNQPSIDEIDNSHTVKLTQALESHGFAQQVIGSTHTEGHTLDVVITSASARMNNLVVNPPVYSDHYLTDFSSDINCTQAKRKIMFRHPVAKIDKDSFAADLTAVMQSNSSSDGLEDTHALFSHYDVVMAQLVDKYAPLKKVRFAQREVFCGSTLSVVSRSAWFVVSKQSTDKRIQKQTETFGRTNSTNSDNSIKESDLTSCAVEFRSQNQKPKNQWKVLSSLLSAPTDSESCPISPDAFQTFFKNKVAAVRLATEGADPPTLPPSSHPSLWAFRTLTTEDTVRMLRASASKSCELDAVPTWLIIELETAFAPILTRFINASLASGHLPAAHKRAIIRPFLKKPGLDSSNPANYRPVSNVTFLSKLIERAVDCQIKTCLSEHNLLPACQSGFRKFHSTETAIAKVYNDIVAASDAGKMTILVMLDYSAAFDTVDHCILLDILWVSFGLSGAVLA
jgi:Reverse transcriptase (RNA-dependent DNA polymerase)